MIINKVGHPLFSIIIPAYNVAEYITTTIESILQQTYTNFEVLIIDDGSTDDTGTLIDNIAASDSRIRVFHQINSGVSAARNLGLDNAIGEWIVFVDGDDALYRNSLEILARRIQQNPKVDLISYNAAHYYDITTKDVNKEITDNKNTDLEYNCENFIFFEVLNHYVVWSETFRRNILGKLRFAHIKNGEDVLFCNSIAFRVKYYMKLDAQLYLYRLLRKGGAYSNKWSLKRFNDYDEINRSIYKNVFNSNKKIDNKWLKRWIGGLLYYRKEVKNLDRSSQIVCYNNHFILLNKVAGLSQISFTYRLWIKISTIFKSRWIYHIAVILPMNIYIKFRRS